MPKIACTDHLGNEFKSIQSMCDYWHISLTTYSKRKKLGYSLEDCLNHKKLSKAKPAFDHLGNKFISIDAMCDHYHISRSTFENRLARHWPLCEALTKERYNNYSKDKILDHKGQVFATKDQLASAYGISRMTLDARLRKGMSLEEALTTPLRTHGYTDHLGNYFKNQHEMAEFWHINESTLALRLRKGLSIEKALEVVSIEVTDHKGITYHSMTAMCDAYEISRSTVERRLANRWSLEEALTYPSTTHKKFKDHLGKEYKTFGLMCKAWNMPDSTVQNRLYKLGYSLEDALTKPTNTQNTVGKTCKDHLGNEYQSVATMCCNYGLPRNVFHRRIKDSWDLEKALTTPPSRANGQGKVIYDHKKNAYSSVGEMCKAYGIDFAMYGSRIRQGWSLEKTLTTPPEEIQIGKKECVDHKGNHFKSQAEMMRFWGVTKDQLRSRIELGWTLAEILESPAHQSHKRPCVDHLGKKWASKEEMLAHYGVSGPIFNRRLNVMGLSLEEALTGHSLHANQMTDPLGNFFESVSDMCDAWDTPTATFYHWYNKLYPNNLRMALVRPKTNWSYKDVKIIKTINKKFYEVMINNHTAIWTQEQICDYYINNFKPHIEPK